MDSIMENEFKKKKEYSNGEITIVWNADLCTHAAYCFTELPEVFDMGARPCIKPMAASTKEIIDQVNRCPTDALTFFYNDEVKDSNKIQEMKDQEINDAARIEIIENGPAVLKGKFVLVDKNGVKKLVNGSYSICRCGQTNNGPFCDGTHYANKFE